MIRNFLWSSAEGKKGFHRVNWSTCCQEKNSGGLGIIDSYSQATALCAKWFLRALQGKEAWKILLRKNVAEGKIGNKAGWSGLSWQCLLLTPSPVKVAGSQVFKSIWAAWERCKPLLVWRGDEPRRGFSAADHSIWWSPLVLNEGKCLGMEPWFTAKRLFRRGVKVVRDLYDFRLSTWKSWQDLQTEFLLERKDKHVLDKVITLFPENLELKVLQQPARSWWKDWAWCFSKPLVKGEAGHIYRGLVGQTPAIEALNRKWQISSSQYRWKQRFENLWSSPIEPKKGMLAWSILHHGLATNERLARMAIARPNCPFCHRKESVKHLFWYCSNARQLWDWVRILTTPVAFKPFGWSSALLGDLAPWSTTFAVGWQLLRVEVLNCIWKFRNQAVFNSSFNFALADAVITILSNCLLQIKVQADKVQIELQHLRELIDHWGAAPCSSSRVPPEPEQPRGRSRERSRHSHSHGAQSAPRGGSAGRRPHSSAPRPRPATKAGTWDSAPAAYGGQGWGGHHDAPRRAASGWDVQQQDPVKDGDGWDGLSEWEKAAGASAP